MDIDITLPTWQLVLLSFLGYTLMCRVLRFQRQKAQYARYPYKTRESFAKMTAQHAFEIQNSIYALEFPFMAEEALEFALFKTYGIPTISKLLVQTKQLSSVEFAARRFADTKTLIAEFMTWSPESERTNLAIARMNYLHSLYQKKKLISNDDMLYTLSLFALEPINWIKRYEWREMNLMEICAVATFWKSIGDAMNISYSDLPSNSLGWHDGLEWLKEVEIWSTKYEEEHMVPDNYNKQTADETTALLLYDLPKAGLPFGRNVVSALMDDRLRKAMMYPAPPSWVKKSVEGGLWLRKLALRYLALPRPNFLRVETVTEKPDSHGKYHHCYYKNEPWYIKVNFYSRWGPQAWMKWLAGRPIPGGIYRPDGYVLESVGPKSLEKMGGKDVVKTKEELMAMGRGGCPFSMMK